MPQIADSLGTPISTLRYRIKAHKDFIPSEYTGKGDKYSDESESIMKEINAYYTQGKSKEEINIILAQKYIRDIEIVQESTSATTTEQQYNFAEISRLNDNLEKLIERMDRQQHFEEKLNRMDEKIECLSRVDRHKKWYKFW